MIGTFPAICDYSWNHPTPEAIKTAGYVGAMRYLGNDGRCIGPAERDALHAAGLGIGLIWETTANRALGGGTAGHGDALQANLAASQLGAPNDVPIFYAIDFEPRSDQYAAVANYFRSAVVLGGRPVRPYGCARILDFLVHERIVPCGWQCVAWSYGVRSRNACQFQELGYVLGDRADHNSALMAVDWLWPSASITQLPQDGDGMARQFAFPSGDTYFLTTDATTRDGFKWQWLDGPTTLADAMAAGVVSPERIPLAVGNDAADALWNRYPVANGPHKRS